MNTPLVSILVPAYCHEAFIENCLDSILNQTYKNIEVLICDDNSSDATYTIINKKRIELEKRFVRVSCSQNETNQGVVKNLNKMIKISHGEYIKSIASDDMLLPNAIWDLVDFYERHKEFDFILSNAVYCGEEARYPFSYSCENIFAYNVEPILTGNLMQRLYEHNFIQAPAVMFKKSTFVKYGLFDESLKIEDWEYWLRVTESGSVGYSNCVTVVYRINGQSLSHFTNDDSGRIRLKNMYENQMAVLKKYENSNRINALAGYRSLYDKTLHEAIDINHSVLIRELWININKEKIKIRLETKLKYIFYKLHILRIIQRIKKTLGLQTIDDYKINR